MLPRGLDSHGQRVTQILQLQLETLLVPELERLKIEAGG